MAIKLYSEPRADGQEIVAEIVVESMEGWPCAIRLPERPFRTIHYAIVEAPFLSRGRCRGSKRTGFLVNLWQGVTWKHIPSSRMAW
jgi:hypothetical protein